MEYVTKVRNEHTDTNFWPAILCSVMIIKCQVEKETRFLALHVKHAFRNGFREMTVLLLRLQFVVQKLKWF